MKYLIWIVLIFIVISTMTGCARATRIVNDVDWIVFDGEPMIEN